MIHRQSRRERCSSQGRGPIDITGVVARACGRRHYLMPKTSDEAPTGAVYPIGVAD